MEFRVLGPLEVVDDGRVLRLGSGKQLALVAYLLLHANEAVSVDRLVDELWIEPRRRPRRRSCGTTSLCSGESSETGSSRSRPAICSASRTASSTAGASSVAIASGDLDTLTEALGLWRGPPLSQVAYEPFAQGEIARLEELRLTALEARIEAAARRSAGMRASSPSSSRSSARTRCGSGCAAS